MIGNQAALCKQIQTASHQLTPSARLVDEQISDLSSSNRELGNLGIPAFMHPETGVVIG